MNPCPRGHESYNFGRPFLVHHFYILSLFSLCLGVEKKIFKRNITFSPFDLYSHALTQEPLPRSHEIYNFGRPLVIITLYLVCLIYVGVEKKILLRNSAFLLHDLYGYAIAQEPLPRGS